MVLPELDRAIGQLISVIYTPVSRTMVLACLEHTKLAGEKSLIAATLKLYIDRLLASDILISIGKHSIQINPLIAEVATRDAVRMGRLGVINAAINKHLPIAQYGNGVRNFNTYNEFVREIRLGLYGNDLKFIKKQFDDYHRYSHSRETIALAELWQQICNNPFDADWFATVIPDLADQILESILHYSLEHLAPADAAFEALPATIVKSTHPLVIEQMHVLWIEQLMLRGKLTEAKELLERLPADWRDRAAWLWGWWYFIQGNDNSAISEYEIALRALKKNSGKRKIYFSSMCGLFFILALLRRGRGEDLRVALEHVLVAIGEKSWLSSTYDVLRYTIEMQMGKLDRRDTILRSTPLDKHHSLEIIVRALCIHWVDKKAEHTSLSNTLELFYTRSTAAGYNWLAMEAAGILSQINPTDKFQSFYQKQSGALQKQIGITNLARLIEPQELWELSLAALTKLQPTNSPATPDRATPDRRLIWAIIMYGSTHQIQPREQSRNAKGEWSKGRNIALKRLRSADDIDYLTPEDLRVCGHLQSYDHNGWGHSDYRFGDRAILALIGHPLVFWEDNPKTRIEVIGGEPELKISTVKDERIVISMYPEFEPGKQVMVQKESPSRLKAIEITDNHRRIAEILGTKNRLEVPIAAKEKVLNAIGSISSIVTIHSDIGGGATNVEEVPSDPQPYIHLLPSGMGLKVTLLSRPFAPAGPYYSPGTGGETVIAEIEGKRLQTHRDLAAERRFANAVVASCPILERLDEQGDEWSIEDPQECLELLLELQAVGDIAMVEWPEGEKMRVTRQAGLGDFKLRIQREQDWFATSGEVQVDKDRVLELQQLLALLDGSPNRFIPLGDGQFLALTQEFRQRLDELRSISDRHGKGLRMHPLAALTMEDWLDDVGQLKADKHWQAHIKKLREAESFIPELPSTLQAELRDYQVDGFRWLARLAHWGVGACLADDMGLGKTLQSLAVILTRAAKGATLIIAPTSVCMNWVSEAEKFAPTLNPIQFGGW